MGFGYKWYRMVNCFCVEVIVLDVFEKYKNRFSDIIRRYDNVFNLFIIIVKIYI